MDQTPMRRTGRSRRPRIRDDEITPITARRSPDDEIETTVLAPASDEIQAESSPEVWERSISPDDEIEDFIFSQDSPTQTSDDDVIEVLPVLNRQATLGTSLFRPVNLPRVRMSEGDFSDVLNRLISHRGRCSSDFVNSCTTSTVPVARITEMPPPLESIPSNVEALTAFAPLQSSAASLSLSPSIASAQQEPGTLSSVFFGIRRDETLHRMSYLERDILLPPGPRLATIFQNLGDLSQVQRILSKWPSGQNALIATSSAPIDVIDDGYCHYSTHFKHIALLDDVLSGICAPIQVHATPASELRRLFCEKAGLAVHSPLYVIYIICESMESHKETPVATPLTPLEVRPDAEHPASVEFLRKTYPTHTASLALLGSGYSRGYVTCLKYRIFENIRVGLPESCGVREEDICAWAGERRTTWKNVKTRAKAAKKALDRLDIRNAQGVLDPLPAEDHRILEVLVRGPLEPLPLATLDCHYLGRGENRLLLQAQKSALNMSALGLMKITKRVDAWAY